MNIFTSVYQTSGNELIKYAGANFIGCTGNEEFNIITNQEEYRDKLVLTECGCLDKASTDLILNSWANNIKVALSDDMVYGDMDIIVGFDCTEGYWFGLSDWFGESILSDESKWDVMDKLDAIAVDLFGPDMDEEDDY